MVHSIASSGHRSLFAIYAILLMFGVYIFPSGLVQPIHLVLALYFLLWITVSRFVLSVPSLSVPWMIFLAYVAIHGVVAGVIYNSNASEFLVSSIQSVFCLLTLFLSLEFHQSKFQWTSLRWPILAVFLSCWSFFLFGWGGFNYYPRYNGFLNDPNQYAYYVINLLAYAVLFGKGLSRLVCIALGLFLVAVSMSRSGLVAFATMVLVLYPMLALPMLLVGVVVLFGIALAEVEVFDRLLGSDLFFELWQRGFYRLVEFPEFLLLGAGKGFDERFGYGHLEVHSTPVAVLFYFGVVGLALYLSGIMTLLAKCRDRRLVAMVLALLSYGLTTYNLRTPITWWSLGLIISFASIKDRHD